MSDFVIVLVVTVYVTAKPSPILHIVCFMCVCHCLPVFSQFSVSVFGSRHDKIKTPFALTRI